MSRGCPWSNVSDCPLYWASHNTDGLGCIDDMARPCIVKRGEATYSASVKKLGAHSLEYMPIEGRC